jgi:hypothetical protein
MKNDRLPGSLSLRVSVSALLLAALLLLPIIPRTLPASTDEEYVYYGIIPHRIHFYQPKHMLSGGAFVLSEGWRLVKASVKAEGVISIIAVTDDTMVRVYELEGGSLVSEASLDALQKHYVELPNGTAFKVVSNRIVFVLTLSGKAPTANLTAGPTPSGFYIAVNGGFIGREFMILASQGLTGLPYHIFSLEEAQVTITREDGEKQSFRLEANGHKRLGLKAYHAYKVESTGNIMIQAGNTGSRTYFVPSAEGGFVGRRFYSCSRQSWDPVEDYGFRIMAAEDVKVKIWDLEFKRLIDEVEVPGGSSVSVKPKAEAIVVESDKPITLEFVHSGGIKGYYGWRYGAGVAYMGVKPNVETLFFLPTNSSNQAYIFAYEETTVRVDDVPITIEADGYFVVTTPGLHKIVSDKNVVIQLVHWPLIPSVQGINGFGVAVPCIQTVNEASNVKLSPIGGEGFPMTYLIVGIVATAAVVGIGLLMMKRRS